jgi:hypothetical protein
MRMMWMVHIVCLGEMRNVYKILVGNSEGKRPLGGPRHRWKDNIKLNLKEIGFEGVNWIHLGIETVGCSYEHGYEPSGCK